MRLVREAAANRSSAPSARRRRPPRVAPCRRMPQLDVRCADRIGRFTDEARNYSEIGRIAGSTERRDRTTTVALQTSAQNGTSDVLAERKHARRLAGLATPRTGIRGQGRKIRA